MSEWTKIAIEVMKASMKPGYLYGVSEDGELYAIEAEMPKSCGECLDIGWHYVFECRLDDVEEGERLPNCPLVPVPEHGRLVDADKIVNGCKDQDGRYVSQFAAAVGETVEAAPTIIPASGGNENE